MKELIYKLLNNAEIQTIPTDAYGRVEALEKKTGLAFPRSFRELLRNYDFDSFDFGGITFFGSSGSKADEELSTAIFNDKFLSEALIENGLLQFGRPDCWSYDPVCFNTRKRHGAECEIVRVDHEEILCHNKVVIVEVYVKSFPELIEKYGN